MLWVGFAFMIFGGLVLLWDSRRQNREIARLRELESQVVEPVVRWWHQEHDARLDGEYLLARQPWHTEELYQAVMRADFDDARYFDDGGGS